MAQYLTLLYSSWMFMAMLRRCWIWRVFHCDRFKRASGLNLESNRRPCRGQLKLLVEHLPNLAEIRSRCGLDNPGSINVVANLVPSSRSSWYSRISVGSLDPKSFRRISCWISGLQFFFGHQSSMRPCPFQWRRGMQWGRYNLQRIQMTPGLPSGKRWQFAMENHNRTQNDKNQRRKQTCSHFMPFLMASCNQLPEVNITISSG